MLVFNDYGLFDTQFLRIDQKFKILRLSSHWDSASGSQVAEATFGEDEAGPLMLGAIWSIAWTRLDIVSSR